MEKDHLRLLYLTKWFLDFFLCLRASNKDQMWNFSMITEVSERSWIVWVLRRMREAVEDKVIFSTGLPVLKKFNPYVLQPKLWTELQAGVECLTQLILLIDCMISSGDNSVADAAEILQTQIIYNGEVLDTSLESLRVYKEGTQSLTFLDSSVHLAYALLKLLEKCSKGAGLVRKKRAARSKSSISLCWDDNLIDSFLGKKKNADSAVPDVEDEPEDEEEEITETTFTFDAFEQVCSL